MAKKDILTLDPKQLQLLAEQAVETEASASNGVQMLSTKNGRLTLKGMPIVGDKVLAVILASPIERNYYDGVYDSTKAEAPDCHALSFTSHDMGPDPRSVNPQAAYCSECPKNQWGSSLSGNKKGKACKETRKVVFLDFGNLGDSSKVERAPLYGIRPPVTSVQAFSNYIKQVSATLQKPAFCVVTEISVVPDAKNQFRTEFRLVKEITDVAMLVALMERARKESANLMLGEAFQADAVQEVTETGHY